MVYETPSFENLAFDVAEGIARLALNRPDANARFSPSRSVWSAATGLSFVSTSCTSSGAVVERPPESVTLTVRK